MLEVDASPPARRPTWPAWVEILLCSGYPSQLVIGQLLMVTGLRATLPDGSLSGTFVFVLSLADTEIEPQPLPQGYALREFAGGEDGRIAFQLVEDAFNEWPDRDPSRYEDWAPRGPLRPGFEPWQIRFAVDPAGTEVGVCYTILAGDTGYVDQLAVRADQRGKGLARALLADAFARAREHGASVSELSTDSRTGALGLYEHVGMKVTQTWRHWMTDL